MGGDDRGVVITLTEMYSGITTVRDEVHEMRAQVRMINDHEARLRLLERRLWFAVGGATIISTGFGAMLAQLVGVVMS
jgi:hypothetical protein